MSKISDKMNSEEWTIFWVLIIAMALIGLTGGVKGMLVFLGLGLIIWLVWRGRKL